MADGAASAGAAWAVGRGEKRTPAAALIFAVSSGAILPMSSDTAPDGLPATSTAPISKQRTVASAPAWVSEDSIRTGVGHRRMISASAS